LIALVDLDAVHVRFVRKGARVYSRFLGARTPAEHARDEKKSDELEER
jgi:hypothetical protein